jgi:FkbM family methyltransferase
MHIILPTHLECEPALVPHLQHVFAGEYDVPLDTRPRVIIDAGANVGAFSLWAAHRFPGSTIHAYEPHPVTFETLKRNIAGYYNITAYNYGLGDPGLRPLGNGLNNSGEASFYIMANNPFPTGQHVEVVSPSMTPPADILKVDTEGCEVEIIAPLIAAGRRFDAIMFEWHREGDRRELDGLLKDYVLIGSAVAHPGRGTARYVHRDLCIYT